jgi:hypothetical protein
MIRTCLEASRQHITHQQLQRCGRNPTKYGNTVADSEIASKCTLKCTFTASLHFKVHFHCFSTPQSAFSLLIYTSKCIFAASLHFEVHLHCFSAPQNASSLLLCTLKCTFTASLRLEVHLHCFSAPQSASSLVLPLRVSSLFLCMFNSILTPYPYLQQFSD